MLQNNNQASFGGLQLQQAHIPLQHPGACRLRNVASSFHARLAGRRFFDRPLRHNLIIGEVAACLGLWTKVLVIGLYIRKIRPQ
jgi:hypothetical protein